MQNAALLLLLIGSGAIPPIVGLLELIGTASGSWSGTGRAYYGNMATAPNGDVFWITKYNNGPEIDWDRKINKRVSGTSASWATIGGHLGVTRYNCIAVSGNGKLVHTVYRSGGVTYIRSIDTITLTTRDTTALPFLADVRDIWPRGDKGLYIGTSLGLAYLQRSDVFDEGSGIISGWEVIGSPYTGIAGGTDGKVKILGFDYANNKAYAYAYLGHVELIDCGYSDISSHTTDLGDTSVAPLNFPIYVNRSSSNANTSFSFMKDGHYEIMCTKAGAVGNREIGSFRFNGSEIVLTGETDENFDFVRIARMGSPSAGSVVFARLGDGGWSSIKVREVAGPKSVVASNVLGRAMNRIVGRRVTVGSGNEEIAGLLSNSYSGKTIRLYDYS